MRHSNSAALDSRFGIPRIAKVVEGKGGLAKVAIATRDAVGEIYLHGAHVTSWRPRGAEEVLFLSSESRWEDGRAIRGGIPICFPWFADKADDPKAPAHGFVRAAAWQLDSIVQTGSAVTVTMFTTSSGETKKWVSADFHLIYRAMFGSKLKLDLVVKNTGATPVRFEEALHTYFRVGQIDHVRLQGLDGIHYLDKTDSNRTKTQHGPLAFVSQTDRVYLNTRGSIELEDHSLRRRIVVAKDDSLTTVVWNPGVEKAKALSDFGDAEWKQMVCVETCNVADYAVELARGREHNMQTTIALADL
jgi:glucose-6-phosphate 1-epimerase